MQNARDLPDLHQSISKQIIDEEKEIIIKEPSKMELKLALNSILTDSSPKSNAFGSSFYVACRDFIKEDLMEAAKEFFSGVALPKFYTSSYVFLIPKVMDPTSFDKFRSICLCSVVYKIFSKIIIRRLTSCLNRIISLEQGAFILGRSIFENITLVQEMIHSLNRKTKWKNVVLKVDMAKNYDHVN